MFPRFLRLQNTSASCRGPREQQPLREHARQRAPRQHAQWPPPQHDGQRLQLPRPQVNTHKKPDLSANFREVSQFLEKASTRAFSLLKVPTSAFTPKTLCLTRI